jgi:hypothetical protein
MSNTVHGVASHKESTPDVHRHHPTLTQLYEMQHSNNQSLDLQVICQSVPNIHEKDCYNLSLLQQHFSNFYPRKFLPTEVKKKTNMQFVVDSHYGSTPNYRKKLQQYFHGFFTLFVFKIILNLLHHFSQNLVFRYSD